MVEPELPARRSRVMWLGAVAAVAVAVVAALAAAFLVGRAQTAEAMAPSSTVASTLPTTMPSASAPELVRSQGADVALDVTVSPLSARVFLDDRPLGTNPFHGRLTKDDTSHVLRAEAPGYRPRAFSMTLDRDKSIDFALVPLVGVGAGGPPHQQAPSHATSAPSSSSGAQRPTITELPTPPPSARSFQELTPGDRDKKPQLDTDALKKH